MPPTKTTPAKAAPPAKAAGKAPGTAVAKKNDPAAALQAAGLDPEEFLKDSEQDLGFGRDDLAIPFLKVLQKGSPEVNKRDAAFVEGSEVGDLFNTVSLQKYNGEKGIILIPVSAAYHDRAG